MFLSFCHNSRVWQTDRQTDGQKDISFVADSASMQRGNETDIRPIHVDIWVKNVIDIMPFKSLNNDN